MTLRFNSKAAIIPLLCLAPLLGEAAGADLDLPTPPAHYASFDADLAGIRLLNTLLPEMDGESQRMVQQFLSPRPAGTMPSLPRSDALTLLRSLNLEPFRSEVLELLIHHSSVLDVVPDGASDWIPVVHDSLLFFLDGLGEERLFERILNLTYLPAGTGRGDRLLKFTDRTASLQKIGQILARNPNLSPDLRLSLQTLENGIATSDADEIAGFIKEDIGQEALDTFQVRFAEGILAEASVGAVMRATLVQTEEDGEEDIVFKVVKPYVLESLPRELEILDQLSLFFEENSGAYGLGDIPLSDTFRDVKTALSSEIRIVDEQRNLVLAETYYADDDTIRVPHLYPLSTPNVTAMEFVVGDKITDAHLGQPAARQEMAERLSDVLTIAVIFSPAEEAIFHGDPHAGNVFHVSEGASDPYQIALLDWGLYGSFPRAQREQLVQLVLGVHLGNTKRIENNVGALIEEWPPASAAEYDTIREIVGEVVRQKSTIFPTLQNLIVRLATAGFQTRFNIALFIKSQITIAGMLLELDPEFDQDDYMLDRATGLVWKEFPRHLLNVVWFPAWNSHNYRSMLSNEDIRDMWTRQVGRFFKSVGGGLARVVTAPF